MALMKCPKCGKQISDRASNCPKCGYDLRNLIICDKCGNKYDKNSNECPYCGYNEKKEQERILEEKRKAEEIKNKKELERKAEEDKTKTEEEKRKKEEQDRSENEGNNTKENSKKENISKKKRKGKSFLIVLIIIAALVVGAYIGYGKQKDNSYYEEAITLIEENNYEDALKTLEMINDKHDNVFEKIEKCNYEIEQKEAFKNIELEIKDISDINYLDIKEKKQTYLNIYVTKGNYKGEYVLKVESSNDNIGTATCEYVTSIGSTDTYEITINALSEGAFTITVYIENTNIKKDIDYVAISEWNDLYFEYVYSRGDMESLILNGAEYATTGDNVLFRINLEWLSDLTNLGLSLFNPPYAEKIRVETSKYIQNGKNLVYLEVPKNKILSANELTMSIYTCGGGDNVKCYYLLNYESLLNACSQ